MHYRCRNCGGNTVYSPAAGGLVCPHCDSRDSGERVTQTAMDTCPVCGAPVEAGEYNSAMRCGSCGSWLILEERVQEGNQPAQMIPFKLTREQAVDRIREEFKLRPFIPKGFMSNKTLMNIEGVYVPFWLYDYRSREHFTGTGQRVRSWVQGDIRFRETSYYEIVRDVTVDFDGIPADASDRMDDDLMDLIEPFDYEGLQDFDPMYMSGFNSEVYNRPASEYVIRSRTKADRSIQKITDDTVGGYAVVTPVSQHVDAENRRTRYTLFPVYRYTYRYFGKDYDIFVNGQTGKIAGDAPTSRGKAAGYTLATFGLGFLSLTFIASILAML